MKNTISVLILLIIVTACAVTAAGCAQKADDAPALDSVVCEKDNKYICSFDGVKHGFNTEFPDITEGAPLVVMLHGYGESAESFRASVHFDEQANALGYAVVYVTGAPDPNDPTSAAGWNSGISAGGNNDTDFIKALAAYLTQTYRLDKERVYAVGFSNGAFMAHRLAAEAGDTFSAVVSVAGKMPQSIWDNRSERADVSFFQINGEKDDVVPKHSDGSARYAKDPAIEDVMDYWAEANGLSLSDTADIGKGSVLNKYTSSETNRQVWHLTVKNGRHSWPDERINGIDANALIMEFFRSQKG